jgi:flagellar hook-associated protein 2
MDARISSSDAILKSLRDREADIDVRLTAKESQLRAQFTALETALSKAQSQGNWLAGQISALG